MTDAGDKAPAKSERRVRHGMIEDWRDALGILLMLFIAAVSGALIARFWPEPDTSQPVTDLTERLAALETRFSAVTSATEPDITSLKSRVAALETRLKAAEAALGTTVGTAATNGASTSPASPTDVVAGTAGASSTQIAETTKTIEQINVRLAALEGDKDALKTLGTRVDDVSTKVQTQGDQLTALATLKTNLDALDTRLSHIEQSDLMTMARRAALSAAIANLMRATQGSGPFTAEYEAVAAMMPGDDPALVDAKKYAASGLPTVGMLALTFEKSANAALDAERSASGADWLTRLWANMTALVTVRPVGEVPGDSTDSRIARAELRLKAGDLPAAVAELQPITGAARTALDSWYTQAEARVKLEKALADLNTHSVEALAQPPASSEPVPQLPVP
ncbi:MAG: hypothetical protein GC190_18900 [Alphaproteobacteria bacterium]|nr:hypothetical protein [Alphaproteobacteria bacterium]